VLSDCTKAWKASCTKQLEKHHISLQGRSMWANRRCGRKVLTADEEEPPASAAAWPDIVGLIGRRILEARSLKFVSPDSAPRHRPDLSELPQLS